MKKLLFLLAFISLNSFASESLLVGNWKTIDDETKKAKSIVSIYEVNGKYFGKIQELFLDEGAEQNPLCDKCDGDKKNQPMKGLEILTNFDSKGNNVWEGGKIIDPKTGKVYSCKLELTDNNQKLKVRGFVGISLIGRTQIWERVK